MADMYNHSKWWENSSSSDPDTSSDFLKLMGEVYIMWIKKHESYGSSNISFFGEKGILIRVYDKMQRLVRMVWQDKGNSLSDESIEDTWSDIAVYCLIAVLVRRGKWPK